MALVLDATVGGAASNVYTTLAEAAAYHEARLYATTWTEASDADRSAALAMATQLLDVHMEWDGVRVTQEQALAWPRYEVLDADNWPVPSTTIPRLVAQATAEFARQLLTKDRTTDLTQAGVKRIKADVIELEFDTAFAAQVLPDAVFDMVRVYGRKKAGRRINVPLVRV